MFRLLIESAPPTKEDPDYGAALLSSDGEIGASRRAMIFCAPTRGVIEVHIGDTFCAVVVCPTATMQGFVKALIHRLLNAGIPRAFVSRGLGRPDVDEVAWRTPARRTNTTNTSVN